jgi:hypothetical protein
MKNIAILIVLVFAVVLTSCEKVIELKLNDSDQKYVIEGSVNNGESVHYVRITKTQKIQDATQNPTVDDATVVISDNAGNSETLTLVEPGLYATTDLLGVENRTYTITVTIEGEVFVASSTIPQQVPFDSLAVESYLFGPTVINSLVPIRIDPAGVDNFYKFALYRNDTLVPGIFLQDDKFADGVEMRQPLFGGDFKSGDLAKVEMKCIDRQTFRYFTALDQNGGGTGGATPANPESNFGKACLGYFSAQTREVKERIVP